MDELKKTESTWQVNSENLFKHLAKRILNWCSARVVQAEADWSLTSDKEPSDRKSSQTSQGGEQNEGKEDDAPTWGGNQ